jgi:hypothetical protein
LPARTNCLWTIPLMSKKYPNSTSNLARSTSLLFCYSINIVPFDMLGIELLALPMN